MVFDTKSSIISDVSLILDTDPVPCLGVHVIEYVSVAVPSISSHCKVIVLVVSAMLLNDWTCSGTNFNNDKYL